MNADLEALLGRWRQDAVSSSPSKWVANSGIASMHRIAYGLLVKLSNGLHVLGSTSPPGAVLQTEDLEALAILSRAMSTCGLWCFTPAGFARAGGRMRGRSCARMLRGIATRARASLRRRYCVRVRPRRTSRARCSFRRRAPIRRIAAARRTAHERG